MRKGMSSAERSAVLKRAVNTIKTLCEDRAGNLYGEADFCAVRLERELEYMEKSGAAFSWLISKEISDYSEALGYPIFIPGALGGSLLAYLLDFSKINPLEPHYRCLDCCHYETKPSVPDRYELARKECPYCGKVMAMDGHGIPMEMYYGQNGLDFNKEKYKDGFEFRAAPSVRKGIIDHLREKFTELNFYHGDNAALSAEKTDLIYYPKNEAIPLKTEDAIGYIHSDFCASSPISGSLMAADNMYLEIIGRISKKSGKDYRSIPLDDASVYAGFCAGDTAGIGCWDSEWMKGILDTVKPADLYELARAIGYGVWEENTQNPFAAEFPATREELYCLLKRHGITSDKAYDVMLAVLSGGRRGLTLSETNEIMEKANLPQWLQEYCGKTRYLFPKSHVLSRAKIAYLLAWYKKYCSECFLE